MKRKDRRHFLPNQGKSKSSAHIEVMPGYKALRSGEITADAEIQKTTADLSLRSR
jgi:hypothetical protein